MMSVEVDMSNLGEDCPNGLFKATVRRTFSGSDPPLTSCAMTNDGKHVLASCLDNAVYRFV